MSKRDIYAIDEKVFKFVQGKFEKSFISNNDGFVSKYEGGLFHIFRHCVLNDNEKIRVFFKKVDGEGYTTLDSSYEFSSEYTEKLKELIFSYEDKIYIGWKEEHKEIEAYISSMEKS